MIYKLVQSLIINIIMPVLILIIKSISKIVILLILIKKVQYSILKKQKAIIMQIKTSSKINYQIILDNTRRQQDLYHFHHSLKLVHLESINKVNSSKHQKYIKYKNLMIISYLLVKYISQLIQTITIDLDLIKNHSFRSILKKG